MRRLLIALVVLVGLGAAGLYWFDYRIALDGTFPRLVSNAGPGNTPAVNAAGRPVRRRGGADPELPVPVLAATAEVRDVPIYLDGLGTVQAFNLVQVRAQIDGPLVEVLFHEGQDVKKGDILARIDPRPYQATLDGAVAKKQQDEATLANDRLDVARYAKLAAGAYSSAQQYDTARSAVAQMEAQVRGDQAQVDTATTQLGYTTIRAAFDGRTGLRQVDVGNLVHASDTTPITVLTQLKPISVTYTLPQQDLQAVAAAMAEGPVEVLALQGAGTTRVLDRGVLAVLDNQVDPSTGTLKLKANFPNPGLKLWPGGFVNVRMLVQTDRNVVTVPPAAVQRGPAGAYVFVIAPDMSVKRVPIKLGHEDETVSVVTAGLAAGDKVVTDGAQRLNDQSKVAIAAPDGIAPAAAPRERGAPGTAQRGTRRNAS